MKNSTQDMIPRGYVLAVLIQKINGSKHESEKELLREIFAEIQKIK